jgi:hypothetical protein
MPKSEIRHSHKTMPERLEVHFTSVVRIPVNAISMFDSIHLFKIKLELKEELSFMICTNPLEYFRILLIEILHLMEKTLHHTRTD